MLSHVREPENGDSFLVCVVFFSLSSIYHPSSLRYASLSNISTTVAKKTIPLCSDDDDDDVMNEISLIIFFFVL